MSEMTPREIVSELDKHIIGQDNAKRSVAIALRNRWRRMQLNEELRHEVTPKNILMIGPTGVGKLDIYAFSRHQCFVLHGDRGIRLGQNTLEVAGGQRLQFNADWQTTLQFRDQVRRFRNLERARSKKRVS